MIDLRKSHLLPGGELCAWRGIGLQIAKDELSRCQKQLFHPGVLVEIRPVPEGAIEDTPFAIAADPDHSIVVVRTSGVAVGGKLSFCGIEAHQDVQLLSRVGSRRKEVIELIEEVEILSCEL